jgi:Leucine-rich repeat (LRR) protein
MILPESISNLTSLTNLSLRGNKLSTLPDSIAKLPSLQILDLAGNEFTTLPDSIKILEERGVYIEI